jgi:NAD+ diphosphatase
MTPHQPGFSGGTLDRADHLRGNEEALLALRQHTHARLLVLNGFDPVLTTDGALQWIPMAEAGAHVHLIFLGIADDVPHFVALSQSNLDAPSFRSPATAAALAVLGAQDLAIYGTARSLMDWHSRHRFCGKCGGPARAHRGGWGRLCTQCGSEHFPRVDPVVIMLAQHQGKALLGRQASWPTGRYSALAGFLEPGETMEEAVARELFEEAGVRATAVRYITSQPWPFPAQLMLACIAEVQSDTLAIATAEIEDAIWVGKEEAKAALSGDATARFQAPPAFAVAHSLLRYWAES